MRNFFYGFLIILAAVILTHTAGTSTLHGNSAADSNTTGGNGATNVSTRTVSCSAVAQTPSLSGSTLNSNVRFLCDSPGADNLWLTVTMQKKASNTDWVSVATSAFHEVGAATTSTASTESRTRGVHANCVTGTFRTVVEAARTSNGTTKTLKSTSGSVTESC